MGGPAEAGLSGAAVALEADAPVEVDSVVEGDAAVGRPSVEAQAVAATPMLNSAMATPRFPMFRAYAGGAGSRRTKFSECNTAASATEKRHLTESGEVPLI